MQEKRLKELEEKLNVTERRVTCTTYGLAIRKPGDPVQEGYDKVSDLDGEPLKVVRARHNIFPAKRGGETLRLRAFFTDSGEDLRDEDRGADYMGPYRDFEKWLKEQHEQLGCEFEAMPTMSYISEGGRLE